jgi:DNA primase
LCPFHNEKTPSFYVVEDKSFFHCFGCGAHGDVVGFLMRANNLDFIEAVEKLAGEAGLAVPQASRQERERAQRQKTLLEATEAAAAFYESRLWSPAGGRAREYLQGRGLDPDTIRRFRVGWAPDDRQVLRRALAADFPDAMLIEAGLARQPEEGEIFDYFRNRVIFPIGDRAGRIIAFGGRVLGDGQPKYLNSPDSPLFEKGRVLYGWSSARAGAAQDGTGVIVTEGYMDVIALHRAGLAGAVAPLGTALTEFQLQELWRLSPEPILCFDGDAAGQRAAVRALHRSLPLLRPGHSLRFATLTPGEDPDSIIRTEGRPAFDQILAAARPLSGMLWELELGGKRLDTPESRADLERRLMEDIGVIANRTVRAEYHRFIRDRLFQLGRPGRNAFRSASKTIERARPTFVRDGPEATPRHGGRIQRENLFRILLNFPWLIDEVAEKLATLELPEPELDRLRHAILDGEALPPGLDARALQQHLVQNGLAATVDGLLLPSVDTIFLARCSDPNSTRTEWVRVAGMLTGGDRCALAEATNDLISDVSPESWERFLAARERTLHEDTVGEDQT